MVLKGVRLKNYSLIINAIKSMVNKKVKKSSKKKTIKKVAKKVIKKSVKKIIKKRSKVSPKKVVYKAAIKRKPIGEVTHFYDKICVAVVKFNEGVAVGDEICFEGPQGTFSQVLDSMQYEHESIPKAKKGQEVGVKTKKPVRDGHKVYRA
ncbi:MAG: hypothetical protein M1155_00020 [Patescibacteria group bacterium]|nr:hypothetical protein [Patescibacteria group bacterium]